jgi:ferrochelatase
VLVICPSFVADCLETLEEIAVEGRETFIEAGGTDFTMVPCLNEHPAWLDCLEEFAREREPQPIERE